MKLPRAVVFFLLLGLFFAAIGSRVASTSRLDSPYYKGTSAVHYRIATRVAEDLSPRARDRGANHPEGYVPARTMAPGAEYADGWLLRAARFFGDADARNVSRRFLYIVSALCVFTAYGIARRLWNCQVAGLLAAGLVAFLPPLITATNGRTFSHGVVAALAGSLHAWLLLGALASQSRGARALRGVATAAAAYALLAVWEPAGLVLAGWTIAVALWRDAPGRARVTVVIAHVCAALAAVATLPHLTSGESFPTLQYMATRLRFWFDHPEAATALSGWMRHVWSHEHAPLPPGTAIQLFIPLMLLAAATALNPACRARGRAFVAAGLMAAGAAVAVVLDRNILPVAALAMIPVVAGGARSLGKDLYVRLPLVILGCYCAFAGVAFREKTPDLAFQIARALDVAHRDPDTFLWVSLENTDRELVRFIATRTSVRESFLAGEDLSALLMAFTGRASALLPGGESSAAATSHVELTRAFYADEASMHTACRARHIDYVIYSIDILLDSGRYSPRYLAGIGDLDHTAVAFRMHFSPESLRYFTLLYENDHYRVFKVSDEPEMVFLTDHPPVYQSSLLNVSGGSLESFRRNIDALMFNYASGVAARSAGDLEGALRLLRSCVSNAPRFTRARLALADVFMDLDRFDDARDTVMNVIEYAPDNSQAMYYAAYISARLGQYDHAKAFLAILYSHERDPDLLEKARLLEAYMEQGLPLGPSAPDGQ
ncbi:MAG TPA: tetratricopeptide repeat protein [Candidatus Krumholzibacteria bacterium]|nr:tetratricopeptide repeat protein [Candidatus Krumholzibacteria bacterium]